MDGRLANLRRAAEQWSEALPEISHTNSIQTLAIGVLLGKIRLEVGEHAAALNAWRIALDQREAMLRSSLSLEGRSNIAQKAGDLVSRLALLELKCNEFSAGVITLERGRALRLRETLSLDETWLDALLEAERVRIVTARDRLIDLHAASPQVETGLRTSQLTAGESWGRAAVLERGRALGDNSNQVTVWAQQLRVIEAELSTGQKSAGLPQPAMIDLQSVQINAWEQEVRAAEAELAAAQKAVGFTRPVLDGPALSALAPVSGAVVLLVAGPDGGKAIVLPAGGVVPTAKHVVDLPGASAPALRAMLAEWLSAYYEFLSASKAQRWSAVLSANRVLGGVLDQLWTAVMGPVLAELAEPEFGIAPGAELVLLPQGDMALLPLHAAWRDVAGERRSVLDEHVVSYVPSGASLRTARRHLAHRQTMGVIDAAGRGHDLFGAFDPTPSSALELRFSREVEMPSLQRLFGRLGHHVRCRVGQPLGGEPEGSLPWATVARVLDDVEGASEAGYVHLSCHGSFDGRDPERSGLQLAGGEVLSVRDMVRHLRLRRTRWVALSACETGMVDVEHLPDEFVGLPAALLQAGAPAVVATLWSVLDGPTALLMPRLYEQHLGKQGGTPGGEQDGQGPLAPAAALRRAVLWLQDMSWGEMNAALAAAAASPGTAPVGPGATRGAAGEEVDADEAMVEFGPATSTQDSTASPTPLPPTPAAHPRPGTATRLSPNTRLRDLPVIWAAYTIHGA